MKKEKGLIIVAMAFFLISGVAACVIRQYFDRQENGPVPVYVNQHWELQPQTTETPEEIPEQKTEDVPAQDPETNPETNPEDPVYYAFTVRGDISALNIRISPGMDAKILGSLRPRQTGYVLEHGEEWSLVTTGKKSGYVYNDYIVLEEIAEEDFPEEYRN